MVNDVKPRSVLRSVKRNISERAVKLAKYISEPSGMTVSATTIRRALYSNGLHSRVPRMKFYII